MAPREPNVFGSAAFAAVFHALLVLTLLLTPPLEPIEPVPKEVDKYAELKAIREKVELPKPEPEPEPEPEIEPEPAPDPEPEPPPPPPKKKKRPRAKPKKKAPEKQAAPPPPAEPAPLVLSNVNLTGGVAVQRGDSDIFGNPAVAATETNTRVGEAEVVSPGPATPPRRVPPRIRKRGACSWPDEAPRLGRLREVRLSLQVDTEGRVAKVKVIQAQGEPFDGTARRCARRLRFYAGKVGDDPTPMWVPWVVEFSPGA